MARTKTTKPRFSANEIFAKAAMTIAIVSGLFSLTVSILLVANYLQVTAINPLDTPQLLQLRQQLSAAPNADEKLISQIRVMDLLARKAFFTSQAHLKTGGMLLLAGVIVLLTALRTARRFRPQLPEPAGPPPTERFWLTRARAKEVLAFSGMLWVVLALLAAYFTPLNLPATLPTAVAEKNVGTAAPTPGAPEASAYPNWETVQKNWPSFRGPGGYGVAFYTTAPTEWDAASGKNIKWKAEVPLPGSNSPVVWEKRLFLSGATETSREIFCFDTETGKLLWRKVLDKFPGTPEKGPKVGEETGYAASTVTAQGDRVMAIFANGDLACYDFDGVFKWGKNLGAPDNHYGYSSSLLAYQNVVFVQYDQRTNGKLFAFDIADGHEVWSVKREKISWASPACVQTSFGPQLVVNSEKKVDAFEPLKGTPLWQLQCLDGEVAPSPAYGGGMFFVANDNATATAIRFGAEDKTPKPEIAWQWDQSLPDVSSPVGTDKHFYMTTSRAEIICLDGATGKQTWLQEVDEGFYASPIVVGDRIYATDRKGVTHVFKTGEPFTLIAKCTAGEEVLATPAFLDGRVYIRTGKNLLCVGN